MISAQRVLEIVHKIQVRKAKRACKKPVLSAQSPQTDTRGLGMKISCVQIKKIPHQQNFNYLSRAQQMQTLLSIREACITISFSIRVFTAL